MAVGSLYTCDTTYVTPITVTCRMRQQKIIKITENCKEIKVSNSICDLFINFFIKRQNVGRNYWVFSKPVQQRRSLAEALPKSCQVGHIYSFLWHVTVCLCTYLWKRMCVNVCPYKYSAVIIYTYIRDKHEARSGSRIWQTCLTYMCANSICL